MKSVCRIIIIKIKTKVPKRIINPKNIKLIIVAVLFKEVSVFHRSLLILDIIFPNIEPDKNPRINTIGAIINKNVRTPNSNIGIKSEPRGGMNALSIINKTGTIVVITPQIDQSFHPMISFRYISN